MIPYLRCLRLQKEKVVPDQRNNEQLQEKKTPINTNCGEVKNVKMIFRDKNQIDLINAILNKKKYIKFRI